MIWFFTVVIGGVVAVVASLKTMTELIDWWNARQAKKLEQVKSDFAFGEKKAEEDRLKALSTEEVEDIRSIYSDTDAT